MTHLQGTNSEYSDSNNVFELAESDEECTPSNKKPKRQVKVSSPSLA